MIRLHRLKDKNQLLTGLIILLSLSPDYSLQAQIVPDNTLPSNSQVTVNGNTLEIDGGTEAGSNLFHSFLQFSIPTGLEAQFNNALTVENIISRVTGSGISKIDGLMKANGNANLLLINPNGIIFGPNASLNIGGSFLASTANSIRFADGSEFSATNPQTSPLLTVTAPIGLQLGQNPSAIRVQGNGHALELVQPLIFFSIKRVDSQTGLQVKPGNTLALVGGSIDIEGGTLTAEDGRIEIGAVSSGLVSLNPTFGGWSLGYEGIDNFQDIKLTQRALADASGVNSGSIQVQGGQIIVENGSVILIENQGSQPGGNITVNASESLELKESSDGTLFGNIEGFLSLLITQARGLGKGGDITISTKQLLMQGGVNIDTLTLEGGARGGNISIYASDSVQLIGGSLNSSIIARTQNSGDAGNIIVSTDKLTILNGSNIISASSLGKGNAGNVTINASEIQLIGINQDTFLPSSISSLSGEGNAGSVEIDTSRLILLNGGQVSTSTLSSGNAGNVIINASEFLEVNGNVAGSVNSSQVISSAAIIPPEQQALFGLPPVPSGASGNVVINTPQLIVTNGGQVTVRNDGTGSAGNLIINADSIFLNNGGGITASTESGEGGNIILNVQDTLQLRNSSFISATAENIGNGGNININANFIFTIPNENNDITANANQGQGGNINITAEGIFGITPRDQITPNSDITASSNFGLEGNIQINRPDVNPQQGIYELPENVVDVANLVSQNACIAGQGSEFIITKRGGLPNPSHTALSPQAGWEDWRLVESDTQLQSIATQPQEEKSSTAPEKIIEAQGWYKASNGTIILTAQSGTVPPQIAQFPQAICQ